MYKEKNILAEDILMGKILNDQNIIPKHFYYVKNNILSWNEPTKSSMRFNFIRKLME